MLCEVHACWVLSFLTCGAPASSAVPSHQHNWGQEWKGYRSACESTHVLHFAKGVQLQNSAAEFCVTRKAITYLCSHCHRRLVEIGTCAKIPRSPTGRSLLVAKHNTRLGGSSAPRGHSCATWLAVVCWSTLKRYFNQLQLTFD